MNNSDSYSPTTQCVYLGREESGHSGFVNPPVYRGSTFLYSTLAAFNDAKKDRFNPQGVSYGRYGTPTSNALEQAIAKLEGGYGAMTVSSGLAAISTAMMALLSVGDHMLIVDSVFGPTRRFCDHTLTRLGIEVSYYSPSLGAEIELLIKKNTKVIFMESPGSLTFEVQDVPGIVNVAKRHNIVTILDNTWATPLFFKAMDHGVNVAIHAATKHIGGHSDIILGLIVTDKSNWESVRNHYINIGQSPASEEVSLALRGLRTLPMRLQVQGQSALQIAYWLADQPYVKNVLHPALPSCPGHRFWKRDFKGSANVFGIELIYPQTLNICAFVDGLNLFGIGASWGGYESLILPSEQHTSRSSDNWQDRGILLRLSIGLESPEDLIADLKQGFNRLTAMV